MIMGIKESKALTKHISCECKCRFDGENAIHIIGWITNVNVSVKKFIYVKKKYEILLHVIVKMENI